MDILPGKSVGQTLVPPATGQLRIRKFFKTKHNYNTLTNYDEYMNSVFYYTKTYQVKKINSAREI
jgi:hypothetical protein